MQSNSYNSLNKFEIIKIQFQSGFNNLVNVMFIEIFFFIKLKKNCSNFHTLSGK